MTMTMAVGVYYMKVEEKGQIKDGQRMDRQESRMSVTACTGEM